MNKEEIIKLAREAGGVDIASNGWTSWVGTQSTEFLERFAALVAEAEREAIIKATIDQGFVGQAYANDFAAVIRNRGKE